MTNDVPLKLPFHPFSMNSKCSKQWKLPGQAGRGWSNWRSWFILRGYSFDQLILLIVCQLMSEWTVDQLMCWASGPFDCCLGKKKNMNQESISFREHCGDLKIEPTDLVQPSRNILSKQSLLPWRPSSWQYIMVWMLHHYESGYEMLWCEGKTWCFFWINDGQVKTAQIKVFCSGSARSMFWLRSTKRTDFFAVRRPSKRQRRLQDVARFT